jgi:hypothetical protein
MFDDAIEDHQEAVAAEQRARALARLWRRTSAKAVPVKASVSIGPPSRKIRGATWAVGDLQLMRSGVQ